MSTVVTYPSPSALAPSGEDLAAWQALSREEQLARYRAALLAPEAGRASKVSMADVLIAARARRRPPWLNSAYRNGQNATLSTFTTARRSNSAPIRRRPI